MLKITKISYRTPNLQYGATVVEFAFFAMLFFVLLFGILEFGRLFYLYNTVQEVTRHAARSAVVNFTSSKAAIQKAAVFRAGDSGVVGLPAGGEVTNLMVSIEYLHGTWNDDDKKWIYVPASPVSPDDNIQQCILDSVNCINFVEAKLCEMENGSCVPVNYVPMVSLFPFLTLPIPVSTVIMPAESLGYAG
jgi:hypothetical protein